MACRSTFDSESESEGKPKGQLISNTKVTGRGHCPAAGLLWVIIRQPHWLRGPAGSSIQDSIELELVLNASTVTIVPTQAGKTGRSQADTEEIQYKPDLGRAPGQWAAPANLKLACSSLPVADCQCQCHSGTVPVAAAMIDRRWPGLGIGLRRRIRTGRSHCMISGMMPPAAAAAQAGQWPNAARQAGRAPGS